MRTNGDQLQQALVTFYAGHGREGCPGRPWKRTRRPGKTEHHGAVVFRVRHTPLETELPAFPQHVPPGDYVVLEVEDQGSGMAPDVLSQSVDPFFTTKEVGAAPAWGYRWCSASYKAIRVF